jgi:hypothetical protein
MTLNVPPRTSGPESSLLKGVGRGSVQAVRTTRKRTNRHRRARRFIPPAINEGNGWNGTFKAASAERNLPNRRAAHGVLRYEQNLTRKFSDSLLNCLEQPDQPIVPGRRVRLVRASPRLPLNGMIPALDYTHAARALTVREENHELAASI